MKFGELNFANNFFEENTITILINNLPWLWICKKAKNTFFEHFLRIFFVNFVKKFNYYVRYRFSRISMKLFEILTPNQLDSYSVTIFPSNSSWSFKSLIFAQLVQHNLNSSLVTSSILSRLGISYECTKSSLWFVLISPLIGSKVRKIDQNILRNLFHILIVWLNPLT